MIMKKLKALLGAESTLDGRERVLEALRSEARRLSEIVLERVEAERALTEAETAAAVGEQVDAITARRKVDEARGAVDRQCSKLVGLRSRLAAQAPELGAQHQAIKQALPAHVEAIKSSFLDEWAAAARVWGELLGKRVAIEGLVGKLTLSAPQAISYEVPDSMAGPWRTLQIIDSALEEIGGWSRAASWPEVDAMMGESHRSYRPDVVYVITNAAAGAEVGAFVVDGSFVPGTLEHLVNIGYAAPLASLDWRNSLEAGRNAELAVRSEREREAIRVPEGLPMTPEEIERAAMASAEQRRPVTDATPHIGRPGPEWRRETAPRRVVGGF